MSLSVEDVEQRASARETEIDSRFPRLVLPRIATLEETQYRTDLFFEEHKTAKVVALDLRGVKDISILTLVDVMSLLAARQKLGQNTFMYLPRNQAVRDMLHQWEFTQAMWDAVGPPNVYISPNDYGFFGEKEEAKKRGVRSVLDKDYHGTLTRDFLAFRHVKSDHFLGEIQRWHNSLIEVILQNRAGDFGKHYFSDRVVYEALTSAQANQEHWGALVASRFSDPEKLYNKSIESENNFVLAVWDQGITILDKMRTPAVKYNKELSVAGATFAVTAKYGRMIQQYDLSSGARPNNLSPDRDLLVHWLSVERFNYRSDEPELGMRSMIHAVCDYYKGQLVVCTDKYRMKVTSRPDSLKGNNGYKYDVEIRQSAVHTPRFLGNLIAVRLPLKP